MKNIEILDAWMRYSRQWHRVVEESKRCKREKCSFCNKWMANVDTIAALIGQKLYDTKTRPDEMPSERIIERLKSALYDNDELWFKALGNKHGGYDDNHVAFYGQAMMNALRNEQKNLEWRHSEIRREGWDEFKANAPSDAERAEWSAEKESEDE